jgi:hypothetical protein
MKRTTLVLRPKTEMEKALCLLLGISTRFGYSGVHHAIDCLKSAENTLLIIEEGKQKKKG